MCGFAFKLGHHGVVDVKCGLHTEAHIIEMDIWLVRLSLTRRIVFPELPEDAAVPPTLTDLALPGLPQPHLYGETSRAMSPQIESWLIHIKKMFSAANATPAQWLRIQMPSYSAPVA
jgi:hypothetical protein